VTAGVFSLPNIGNTAGFFNGTLLSDVLCPCLLQINILFVKIHHNKLQQHDKNVTIVHIYLQSHAVVPQK